MQESVLKVYKFSAFSTFCCQAIIAFPVGSTSFIKNDPIIPFQLAFDGWSAFSSDKLPIYNSIHLITFGKCFEERVGRNWVSRLITRKITVIKVPECRDLTEIFQGLYSYIVGVWEFWKGEESARVLHQMGHLRNSSQENVFIENRFVVDPDEWVVPYGQFKELLLGFNLIIEVYFGPNLYNFLQKWVFYWYCFKMSCLFRLPVKTRLPPYFPSSSSKKSFHFPRLDSSRYFLIQVFFKNTERSYITRLRCSACQ